MKFAFYLKNPKRRNAANYQILSFFQQRRVYAKIWKILGFQNLLSKKWNRVKLTITVLSGYSRFICFMADTTFWVSIIASGDRRDKVVNLQIFLQEYSQPNIFSLTTLSVTALGNYSNLEGNINHNLKKGWVNITLMYYRLSFNKFKN